MISSDYFDAVVVGGGPAGSSTARTLTRAGMDVLVLDKSPFPRDKVCAGWITLEAAELAELDPEAYRENRTLQPIHRFRTGMLGRKMVTTDYEKTISYGILRREFDDYLLQRSEAKLRLGEPLIDIKRYKGEWRLNNNIRTPLLIGAAGHACPVARRLNPRHKDHGHIVVAQEAEFPISEVQAEQCQIAGEMPELYFLPELDGYGWCFRKGNFLNIGLGRTENRHLGHYVQKFHRYLAEQGRIPDISAKFHGHAYRLSTGHNGRKVLDDGVMLVGDAVGLAFPQSGEGIRTAIESGITAAKTAIEANGDYCVNNLKAYQQALNQRYRNKTVSGHIPGTVRHFFARQVLSNRLLTRHIVLDNWFLHPDSGNDERFSS